MRKIKCFKKCKTNFVFEQNNKKWANLVNLVTSSVPKKKAVCRRYLFAQKWPNLGYRGIVQFL